MHYKITGMVESSFEVIINADNFEDACSMARSCIEGKDNITYNSVIFGTPEIIKLSATGEGNNLYESD